MNKTIITLIPKVQTPESMAEFRPISLCNVLYKIIAKVLTNRLRSVLGEIISENQCAFIPGRLINDNTIVGSSVSTGLKEGRGSMGPWQSNSTCRKPTTELSGSSSKI
ncbi:hypothetical protein Ddye_030852 [Dipteronia dyeriana]|uniref:Reverse transcriptase domain-containing protein n=1 Tax=Dipteronia dyeriana TaxID=168575 RepID=A0AAD9WN47_9ROSI|nr:hypothetical protein Ddye_030852 [Dipteronia dyeriana]